MKDIVMKIFYAVRALPGVLWTIYLVKTNNQGFIWTVVDITSAIPTFVNVAVILILSNQYFKLLKDYKARNFGQGTVDKNACLFYEENEIKNIQKRIQTRMRIACLNLYIAQMGRKE